jgi:hypothetical protein
MASAMTVIEVAKEWKTENEKVWATKSKVVAPLHRRARALTGKECCTGQRGRSRSVIYVQRDRPLPRRILLSRPKL